MWVYGVKCVYKDRNKSIKMFLCATKCTEINRPQEVSTENRDFHYSFNGKSFLMNISEFLYKPIWK